MCPFYCYFYLKMLTTCNCLPGIYYHLSSIVNQHQGFKQEACRRHITPHREVTLTFSTNNHTLTYTNNSFFCLLVLYVTLKAVLWLNIPLYNYVRCSLYNCTIVNWLSTIKENGYSSIKDQRITFHATCLIKIHHLKSKSKM